jgi:hypothetical protein
MDASYLIKLLSVFFGSVFPINEKFKKERESFYMIKNLEHELVPKDNKNKGYYKKFSQEKIFVTVSD